MINPPFCFDAPEDSPRFLLWQTTISWQRLIKKALEPHDISHTQLVIGYLALIPRTEETRYPNWYCWNV